MTNIGKWLNNLFIKHYMPMFWIGVIIAGTGIYANETSEEGDYAGLILAVFGWTLCTFSTMLDKIFILKDRIDKLEKKK